MEDLLKPRYKVIAPYPFNDLFPVGRIISDENQFVFRIGHKVTYLSDYPNIFKTLEWWEDRKLEDMPEYLKYKRKVIKISKWFYMGSEIRFHSDEPFITSGAYGTLPATKEEYENQKINV